MGLHFLDVLCIGVPLKDSWSAYGVVVWVAES